MGIADERLPMPSATNERNVSLAREWRWLTWAATGVAILTAPAFFLWIDHNQSWGLGWELLVTFTAVIAFRGLVDLLSRRFIPWPSLFGADGRIKQEDVTARRRVWFWRGKYRLAALLFGVIGIVWVIRVLSPSYPDSFSSAVAACWNALVSALQQSPTLLVTLFFLFLINLVILFGPLLFFSIQQIQGFEPGDANWGVKLDDVRGQAEAKEEVSKVVSLWQSGDDFERAGGKRERGLLFLGSPGTGKTMMAKAIATGFNCPFVTAPGSGFAQAFLGMDALVVRWLAWKAKRLAKKWGGQCIVFIDEIDAVGMRRSALGGAGMSSALSPGASIHDLCFYGPQGALTPTGDLILETEAWREKLFASRAEEPRMLYPPFLAKLSESVKRIIPGGMMGGGMGQQALQQLLVVMDGVDNPPFFRKLTTNKVNNFLDACYVVPQRVGKVPLRLPHARPAPEQIYFIGACNVPIEALDPALTRPGRMGRHVWFRTPDKHDRLDILDRYITKVAHEADLDTDRRRDEMARITNGYSPAMIEQVCSMALTYAHHEGRERFGWGDMVEAMTVVESGMAVNVEYIPELARAVAIHEAGHAVAGHVYKRDTLSTRLSIKKRGDSLGHHQAMQTEERFFHAWRSEQAANLVWTVGSMAAELVFYGETSTGVGGDLHSATATAAFMVGSSGMGPERVNLNARFADADDEREARATVAKRFEEIGNQLLARASAGSPMAGDPVAGVLGDPYKRRNAAELLGQAFVTAYWLMQANREGIERIADTLIERREIFGDEVVELLERADLTMPDVDVLDEAVWPKL